MNIVCYTGGTCGDMISAILDSAGGYFTNNRVMFDQDRTQLKKPHLFNSDTEKDQYLIEAGKKYRSIPSHDLDYHIRNAHDFIGITVQDNAVALWAATRFKKITSTTCVARNGCCRRNRFGRGLCTNDD